MKKITAIGIAVFCLVFIGITYWGMLEIEKGIENHYKGVVSRIQNQKDSVQHILDSVDAEAFRTTIDLGRYEVGFKIFAERNPKGAEQLATIISQETE